MRIAFAGNNERGIACLKALVAAGEQICVALAHPPAEEEAGYYRSIGPTAEELGIPVLRPEKVNTEAFRTDLVERFRPELMVMVGYSKLIKRQTIELFEHGCFNCHASPLPWYRGAATLNWQLIRGEERGAISIIDVDEGVDTGDIVAQEAFGIAADDTIATLAAKVNALYPPLLVRTVAQVREGTLRRRVQDPDEGSYFTKRRKADGRIDWKAMTAQEIHNLVRALTWPYPGAFTERGGRTVQVWRTELLETGYFGSAGRVAARRGDGVVVICKDRGVLVTSASFEPEPGGQPAREVLGRIGSDLG